ncbi:MAG: CapA family protein [Ruminococcaceae bacterium]|nr:CapA family protein [Oscillospiraceae bacterium]
MMRNKEARIFFALVLTVVVLFGIVVAFGDKVGEKSVPVSAEVTTQEQTTEADTRQISVNFISAGDNLIHDGIYEQAKARAGGNGYDFSLCYRNIVDTVSAADVATINQETVIAESYAPSGYPLFNSPKEVGSEIVKAGFDVIAMANNHMLDKTSKGLSEAIAYWDSIESVTRTGAYKNAAERDAVEFIESNGLKIGLIGITQYTNGLSLPADSELRIIYSSEEDVIKAKIEKTKAECDMVLVNIHWGNEYQTTPTQDQRNLAVKMANWGADVIIGHHPHVIQPVEFIDRDDGGRTLVAFSLGNFISQQNTPARVVGGMIKYTVTKDFANNSITISNVKFLPTVTHYVRGVDDVQVYLLSQYTDQLAKKQASRLKENAFSVEYINNFVSGIIDAQFLNAE